MILLNIAKMYFNRINTLWKMDIVSNVYLENKIRSHSYWKEFTLCKLNI
ncbi:hypothetical protein MTBBW1_1270034 [Desulfamplus magnetovallimortis]|uniref:Uncharacterized protein n=1 Tax=Desulfamplus magnetovallimortis TaxID=1246637 RepID=A0A1W1H6X1_9BACT|nr:hypothetical protein MTBBW1_1270034 [Desulfamplus magnetovallimortis]